MKKKLFAAILFLGIVSGCCAIEKKILPIALYQRLTTEAYSEKIVAVMAEAQANGKDYFYTVYTDGLHESGWEKNEKSDGVEILDEKSLFATLKSIVYDYIKDMVIANSKKKDSLWDFDLGHSIWRSCKKQAKKLK